MKAHKTKGDTAAEFERALGKRESPAYVLRLYVAGTTPRSLRALSNIKAICEEHLHGRYDLQVIDVYQQPGLAKSEHVLAVPTLIKKLPAPLQKWIGDLSNTEQVLVGLDLRPKPARHEKK